MKSFIKLHNGQLLFFVLFLLFRHALINLIVLVLSNFIILLHKKLRKIYIFYSLFFISLLSLSPSLSFILSLFLSLVLSFLFSLSLPFISLSLSLVLSFLFLSLSFSLSFYLCLSLSLNHSL